MVSCTLISNLTTFPPGRVNFSFLSRTFLNLKNSQFSTNPLHSQMQTAHLARPAEVGALARLQSRPYHEQRGAVLYIERARERPRHLVRTEPVMDCERCLHWPGFY